ncbi:polyketide synthase [Metarhizium anisopliae]
MHPGRFRGLQNVMETAEVVLRVTSGANEGKDPDANVTPRLSSTLQAERLHLRLQFLDTDNPSSIDPSILAKMLLRLAFLDPSKTNKLLWTQEPELVLKDGTLITPSVDTMNSRSAARIRQVTQATRLGSKSMAVMLNERQGAFELHAVPAGSGAGDNALSLSSENSSLVCYRGPRFAMLAGTTTRLPPKTR